MNTTRQANARTPTEQIPGEMRNPGLTGRSPGSFRVAFEPGLTRAVQVAPRSVAAVRTAGTSRVAIAIISRSDFIRERYAFKRDKVIRLLKAFLRNFRS
jgi:hypothetical protein